MKPTNEELTHALKVAENMTANNSDMDHLALSLTHLNNRNRTLEELLVHLERYLQFGTPTEEHAKLTLLVAKLREQALSSSGDTELDYGL